MQRERGVGRGMLQPVGGSRVVTARPPAGGCYRVQVLVAGHRKRWRDEVSSRVRRAGYQATACDSAVDALAVLVLGLPVDVLVADLTLQGTLGCSQLAAEARALRPGLRIVLTDESGAAPRDAADLMPDAHLVRHGRHIDAVASMVREAVADRWA